MIVLAFLEESDDGRRFVPVLVTRDRFVLSEALGAFTRRVLDVDPQRRDEGTRSKSPRE